MKRLIACAATVLTIQLSAQQNVQAPPPTIPQALTAMPAERLERELERREVAEHLEAAGRQPSTNLDPSLAVYSTPVIATALNSKVIYGPDDRKEIFLAPADAAIARNIAATVALVNLGTLRQNGDGSWSISAPSLKAEQNVCDTEQFKDEPAAAFCSGFLVAPDVIATAGHCVETVNDLQQFRFVFGFAMTAPTQTRTVFTANDVYRGVDILGRVLTPNEADWALVRLERGVLGRNPVRRRAVGQIADFADVYVVGHPSGLPAKFAPNAKVRRNDSSAFFVANLDTYGGNSGSPVFNAISNEVEGILVRGETDFISAGACRISKECPSSGCRGEDVTRITILPTL
jgi:hypothetical protein